jgi:Zn-dependent M28 family amino/carboxypeptidase
VDGPSERIIPLRNVIGLLRGSDPKLRETYVLVTAHYDHLGVRPTLPGDRIFNGANDDASGTASVIELAAALSSLRPALKRSLIFLTFFGEEHGLLGSRYYARHPAVPLEQTVADINLEQVGRTDSIEGPQRESASMTGFDYSSIGPTFQAAGARVDIRVSKHERFSDPFFGASDNYAFAVKGIPAHTICVAYQFPDYHKVGDHWDKVDFANMSHVDRMVALGLLTIANDPDRPRWNESNPKAARYAQAAKKP